MGWKEQLDLELDRAGRAEQAGNSGKARTSARRAAAVAINEYQRRRRLHVARTDVMSQLQWVIEQQEEPRDVRSAAARLAGRLSADFTSPSTDPVADAMLIINHYREWLES